MKRDICKIFLWEVCVITLTLCSCISNRDGNLGDYESIAIKINPMETNSPFEATQYIIDSIRPLDVPDNLSAFEEKKVFANDRKVYILDSDVSKTILVFDIWGHYLYKLGERGRAKNEYPYGPTDFFVTQNGDVHVFDMDGKRILIFDDKGKFKNKIETPLINSFGMTSNGKYLYCIDNPDLPGEEPDPSLLLYDIKSDKKMSLIPSKHYTYHYYPRFRTFFNNDDKLYHIPILSDSVIVFKDDVVEKVIRFDFTCGFLSKEKPETVRNNSDGTPPNVSRKDYQGVNAIHEYQESDSYIYMRYLYQFHVRRWFYNKRTKQIVHGNRLFAGLNVFNDYFLKGNQIIAYVGRENVEMLKEYCESEDVDMEEYKKTPSFVKMFQSGKLSAPALVYITIK